jgi:hypothetical protein
MSYSPVSFNEQSTGSAESITTNYTNASGSVAIPQAMAVYANSSGLIVPLNVSSQASVSNMVGYANVRIPVSASGPVILTGRLKLYTNTNSYPLGTPLYIGTDANPTNIIPVAGSNGFVSGDYCIFMGVLVPNEVNILEFDISLFTQVVGVL